MTSLASLATRQAAPDQVTPSQAAPGQATPDEAAPNQGAPSQAAPSQAALPADTGQLRGSASILFALLGASLAAAIFVVDTFSRFE
ncbi:MAG: hypothetical protein J0H57_03005, partial [Rhodospirillales bacterium]|nr:hypothetical protein [Rhodospirillales bacterium]